MKLDIQQLKTKVNHAQLEDSSQNTSQPIPKIENKIYFSKGISATCLKMMKSFFKAPQASALPS